MDKHEGSERLRRTVGEGGSVAALMLVMGLGFVAYFVARFAMREHPLPMLKAIAFLPS